MRGTIHGELLHTLAVNLRVLVMMMGMLWVVLPRVMQPCLRLR
jgi:hypothetical protein